jgi:hypothetical protein
VARYSSNALNYRVSGAVSGGVEKKAETNIPTAKTYELAWGSPRRAGGTVKVRFSCGH